MITTVLLVVAALLLTYLLSLIMSVPTPRQIYYLSLIPGSTGIPLLGSALEMATIKVEDVLDFFMRKSYELGRLAKIWVMGLSLLILSEPEDVQVLLSSANHIRKGIEYTSLMTWLNDGLLTSSGSKWQKRRKILTPSFHFKILEESITTFNKHNQLLCAALERTKGRSVNVHDYMTRCTLDVITESAMGIDLGTQNEASQDYLTKVKRISELAVYRLLRPHLYRELYFFISSTGQEFHKLKNYLQNFTSQVIKQRQETYLSTRSFDKSLNKNQVTGKRVRLAFLDTLLEIEARTPGSLNAQDIREEVDTFMFEGHDTTSQAMTFFFFNIGTYIDVQEKVYQELQDIFGDDCERDITKEDLQRMSYLEQTVKESLRLFPSVPYLSRHLETDLYLDGALIPAGTNMVVMPYRIHRNEKHWPNPEKFDPERFNEDITAARHPFAYIPFSAGSRNCIGQKFAMMELKSIAAAVLRKYRVTTETKRQDFKLTIHLILRPTVPIVCTFHPRQ